MIYNKISQSLVVLNNLYFRSWCRQNASYYGGSYSRELVVFAQRSRIAGAPSPLSVFLLWDGVEDWKSSIRE